MVISCAFFSCLNIDRRVNEDMAVYALPDGRLVHFCYEGGPSGMEAAFPLASQNAWMHVV